MSSMNIYPYVYRLTHKETGKFYVGFRCANKVTASNDIGIKYFTSSKTINRHNIQEFDVEVVAEFFDKEAAYEFEQHLILENWNSPLMLNKMARLSTHMITKEYNQERKNAMAAMQKRRIDDGTHNFLKDHPMKRDEIKEKKRMTRINNGANDAVSKRMTTKNPMHNKESRDKMISSLLVAGEQKRRKKEAKYNESPKKCKYCGSDIPYERRNLKCCSDICARNVQKESITGNNNWMRRKTRNNIIENKESNMSSSKEVNDLCLQ